MRTRQSDAGRTRSTVKPPAATTTRLRAIGIRWQARYSSGVYAHRNPSPQPACIRSAEDPKAAVPSAREHFRCRMKSGRRYGMLIPPPVTQMYGPAVGRKRRRRVGGERSCINVSDLCLELGMLRAIMDISALAISLADRPQRAIWVTRVRRRREDRSSISSHPLADLGRTGVSLCHLCISRRSTITPAERWLDRAG
jgi:hypothetical protein